MDPDQLVRIMPYARKRVAIHALPLGEAMDEFDISTPARQAAFIAQIAHESGELQYVRELDDGLAYNGRSDLGNTEPEALIAAELRGTTPGPFYKGHGLIQITGFYNHKRCGEALGIDLVNEPDLLEKPEYASRGSAWFWYDRGLNELADAGDFETISVKINGRNRRTGLPNGWAERLRYWDRAKAVLMAGEGPTYA